MPEIFGAALMGGGTGKAFAAIGVTYPAGATCTCSLGSKTLTAPDTSGQALFIVPYAGEWVVTITATGQQPKSQTVSVTDSKAYTVELSFELWLYTPGNKHEDVTGGWDVIQEDSTVTFGNDGITCVIGGWTANYVMLLTKNKIDVSNFSTLNIEFSVSDMPSTGDRYIGVTNNRTSVLPSSYISYAKIPLDTVNTPIPCDVSNIFESAYIKAHWNCEGGGVKTTSVITKIWLE